MDVQAILHELLSLTPLGVQGLLILVLGVFIWKLDAILGKVCLIIREIKKKKKSKPQRTLTTL